MYSGQRNANFLGMGKKAKAKRTERKAARAIRANRRESRKNLRLERQKSRTERQKNGEGFFQQIGGAASKFAENFAGGGAGDEMTFASETPPAPKDNTMLYIGIAVGVVILVFVFKDKF